MASEFVPFALPDGIGGTPYIHGCGTVLWVDIHNINHDLGDVEAGVCPAVDCRWPGPLRRVYVRAADG